MLKIVAHLLKKELLMETRQKYAVGSVFLYVASTIFVSYLSFRQINDVNTWNALFWIIILFTAFNALAKSFAAEGGGRQLYLYTLAPPQAIILSKTIFNLILMIILCLISLGIYSLFLGTTVLINVNWLSFISALILGGAGFSFVLTMISAIAAQTNNNIGIMAILGFPVILPLLLTLMRFSKNAIDGIAWSVNQVYALNLLAIIAVVGVLSFILFPYLWRE